ncbi:MAG: hypothetical protein WAO35_07540 [Terriglobia bacterium]
MKLRKTLCVTIVAMAFIFAASAPAPAMDSGNVLVHYDVTVAGSHLPSGSYNIRWETHSPEATVSFLHRNKVVATAQGKIVDRGRKYSSNEVVYYVTDNGARQIQEIRFGGSSEVIVFAE